MRRITTFRLTTDRIYDGGPTILYTVLYYTYTNLDSTPRLDRLHLVTGPHADPVAPRPFRQAPPHTHTHTHTPLGYGIAHYS